MPTLSITKTYLNGQVLTETDLDNIKSSIETFINTTKLDSSNIQLSAIADTIGADMTSTGANAVCATITNTATSAAKVLGTTAGGDAASGIVGEYITNKVDLASCGTTAQYFDGTSIALTAGDWDVTAIISYVWNSATWSSSVHLGISTTSGNSSTGLSRGQTQVESPSNPTAANDVSLVIPNMRVSISTPTTYYLKGFATYSAGTAQYACKLSARRVR